MPPRRVALVIGQLQLGGAERQLYELAIRLDRARFEPVVVCLSSVTEPFAGRLEKRGIPVEVVPRAGNFELNRVRALARILRRRRIELAHSFLLAANAYVYAARVAMALAPGTRPRFIASSRACSPAVGAWTMALHRRAFRAAAAVIANSRIVREHTERLYGLEKGRIRVIHNGLPLENYSPPAGDPRGEKPIRSSARDELAVPEGTILVGTLARLSPEKNLDLVLDLAARLAAREDSGAIRFLVVGTGPSEEGLKARAKAEGLDDRVRFTGARQDVYRIMTAIDIFVLTSRFEGLPNAVMEAMAAGRPVVATRTGGTEELVEDEETGYLVAGGDAAELADRVSRLASDGRLREAMGRRGRKRIESSFSVETMVSRTMALYDEVLG